MIEYVVFLVVKLFFGGKCYLNYNMLLVYVCKWFIWNYGCFLKREMEFYKELFLRFVVLLFIG